MGGILNTLAHWGSPGLRSTTVPAWVTGVPVSLHQLSLSFPSPPSGALGQSLHVGSLVQLTSCGFMCRSGRLPQRTLEFSFPTEPPSLHCVYSCVMGLPSALPGQEGSGPIKEAPRSLVYSLPFSDETHI